ncbi:tetratricopeptide repeat protein [Spirosoma pollinicola]|uniref:Uncharacterized protein n=1 Tax=Spirosoma pollinicola TaxID=2057025 RepID=A0A2K8ZA75_9BACT|nr:tetratricopeptide repeat protein [Spirosoma pollinicola]AUD06778.1 hypothetical protein CWM47_35995 [Spirosoma pollinicola]
MNLISKIFGGKRNISQSTETVSNPLMSRRLSEARQSFKNGDYQQALLHCEEVLNLEPMNAEAYRIRGVARYQLKDAFGAAEDLQYSLKFS